MKHKPLLPLILPFLALKAYAYTDENFLEQMHDEGMDISFVDQHENIIMFLLGVLLSYVAVKLIKEKDTRFTIVFSGIIIALYGAVNMFFGATYGEYLLYAIPTVLIICLLIYFIFSSRRPYITGKLFLSIPIFGSAVIMMAFWNFFIDYNICDSRAQWPSEYGLQWRPAYQGFTDRNYFQSVEKHVDSTDTDGILERLLIDEINTTSHPFDILKKKGWTIGESNEFSFL